MGMIRRGAGTARVESTLQSSHTGSDDTIPPVREPPMRLMVVALLLSAAVPVFAAEDRLIDLPPTDDDFPFVGEYIGNLTTRETNTLKSTRIGLQVVALGDGEFEAVEYLGGLPGLGWNGRDKAVLPGHRVGNQVEIDAVPVGIRLDGIVGRVGESPSSPVFGTLRRINRCSPTLGRRPPPQATVLFDGRSGEHFSKPTLTNDRLLCAGAETIESFTDFTMHVEYRLPYMPSAKGQGRANSGVYLQRRYEVQILDSFGQPAEFNTAASIYRTKPADINMSFPPLTWQTYDIHFKAARYSGDEKIANARLTVWHNGVKVHDDVELTDKTGNGKPEGPNPLPILLQDHGNPVHFRNVWLVDHTRHPDVDARPKIGPLAAY